jgi:GSH-dependent disulfide-bond oxidoreductase
MIDLYSFGTPNGRKVSIALEEMGLAYEAHIVDITKNEQFAADFLKISPNNKIPAIVDRENGLSLFESGTILAYLGEKTGKFLPREGEARWRVNEWLMWQMAGFGPMLGRAHYFLHYNKGKSEFAEAWFKAEVPRLYGVLDKQLSHTGYVAGDYSIADMAIFPWVTSFEAHEADLKMFPNVLKWYRNMSERPAVVKGFAVPDGRVIPTAS